MKILFVISRVSIEEGGAAKMLVWLANQSAKHGHDVIIHTHKNMVGDLFPVDSRIKLISHEQTDSKLYPLIKTKNIRKIIRDEKPDIIVPFMSDSILFCLLAAIGTKIPVVICERNDPSKRTVKKFKMSEKLWRLADGAVFQLQEVADYCKWVKCPKEVIPNPVPVSEFSVSRPFSERKNEICVTSRLEFVQKRQDVVIKAFAILVKKYNDYKLVLYGDGPNLQDAKDMVNTLNLSDKVEFRGSVSKPIQYITDSKIFVLCSDFEGISNSLTEAMAAGMTVVSTDTSPGGARMLIQNGENGMLVQCGNYEKLAESIAYCIEHPDHSDKMGSNAKKVCSLFSEENIFKKWENFFKRIIKNQELK